MKGLGGFMLFSSLTFLFIFLPIVLLIYYVSNRRFRNYVLLIFSLFFYGYGGPKLLIYMISSIFMNYILGLLIEKYRQDNLKAKIILVLSVFLNLSFIGYFKYSNFILNNINVIFRTSFPMYKVALPIGISFYTFHSLSYLIDIYRGSAEVLRNPFTLILYISFFPQLVAGPIVRYETIASQFYGRKETIDKFANGIERFILGLSKKVLIANSMGYIADQIFNTDIGSLSVLASWVGAIAYTFQIYFDFSGYSDMALGLANMFGFEFLENFNYPYISKSITEFWRRWHISLGTWFRDYVYIPLGGNKVSRAKHLRNIFVVWFLTGLWHGANWTFIAWGLYFGILLTLEKYVFSTIVKKLWKPLQHIYTMFFVIIGWVLFRSQNFNYAAKYIKNMLGFGTRVLNTDQAMFYITEFKLEFLTAIIFSMPILMIYKKFNSVVKNKKMKYLIIEIIRPVLILCLFIITVIYLVNSTFNPFIYFKF